MSVTRKTGENSQVPRRQNSPKAKVVVNRNNCSETEQFCLCDSITEKMCEGYLQDASLNSNGDFELQIVKNLPFLRKIASKYLKNEEDQKDLIQDTVYKALIVVFYLRVDSFKISSD